MAKDCIICGEPAGSREHTFPAALGGRRTNKGIYCGDHNEGYSPLAAELSAQLKAINALLGVRGDHASVPHETILIDEASGRKLALSRGKVEFADPEIKLEAPTAGTERFTGRFSSEKQFQDWKEARRAEGEDIKVTSRGPWQEYHPSGGGTELRFGGPDGLRAIGYVAQTFLAHNFPAVARSPYVSDFKKYTLGKLDAEFVWWDFEFPATLPPNHFAFGHRILIGLDPISKFAYARISLFSALHFAALFGRYLGDEAGTVITDIDPLAEHPPNDLVEKREPLAIAVVASVPVDRTKSLAGAISSGRSHEMLSGLLRSIGDRDRRKCAERMVEELKNAGQLDAMARKKLFEKVLGNESQRVLNLMGHIVEEMKKRPENKSLVPFFEPLVAVDPTMENGLSPMATAALRLSEMALVGQMLDDYAKGELDLDRMEMLIGGGPGAAIVGQAMADPIMRSLPE
jgi:hypothetical protein